MTCCSLGVVIVVVVVLGLRAVDAMWIIHVDISLPAQLSRLAMTLIRGVGSREQEQEQR